MCLARYPSLRIRGSTCVEVGEVGNFLCLKTGYCLSSASSVKQAVRVCFLVPISMGSPSSKKRKPEVGLRLYAKAEVTSGSWSSCVDSADPVPEFARGCPSTTVSVWTSFN